MGQYSKIKCPICGTQIETLEPVETCPACKEDISDRLWQAGDGTGIGINTATSISDRMHRP